MRYRSLLFEQTTNRALDLLRKETRVAGALPTESELAARLGVSRTTVRKVLQRLAEVGVVDGDGRRRTLSRRPVRKDYFAVDAGRGGKSEVAERFVLQKLSRRELEPGGAFSELELARESGCSTVTIREVLLRISRFGLIEKRPRHQWRVVRFTEDMINELLEMREILELHGIERLLKLPADAPLLREVGGLLKEHLSFRAGARAVCEFPDLDDRVHKTFLAACRNRYVDSFHTMCSFLIYYQIRPQELGARRVTRAIDEHIRILDALVERDKQAAIKALSAHVEGAKSYLCAAAEVGEWTGESERERKTARTPARSKPQQAGQAACDEPCAQVRRNRVQPCRAKGNVHACTDEAVQR